MTDFWRTRRGRGLREVSREGDETEEEEEKEEEEEVNIIVV